MNAENALETIAQIGVALAGFAGIVGALAGEKFRPTHPEVWFPFWALISSGLGIVFVALFPFLLHHFDAPDNIVWAGSSAFLFVVTASNLAFFLPRILRAARNRAFRRIPIIAVPVDSASFLILGTQALNALGFGFVQSTGGFLVGLYLLLAVSALNFAFLLFVLGRTSEGPKDA
jgi:hypothetical protein